MDVFLGMPSASKPFTHPGTAQACSDILVALTAVSLFYCIIHVARSIVLSGATSVAPAGTPLNISLEFGSAVVMSPILFVLYASGTLALGDTLDSRWVGITRATYAGLILHTALDLLGTILFFALRKEALLFLHHALTLSIVGTAAVTGCGNYYCALAGTIELTNFPLFVVTCGPSVGIKAGSLLHTVCGASLWLGFSVLRMGLLPYGLAHYLTDVYSAPEATILKVPPLLRYLQWPAGVIVLLMSTFWYIKITKGLLKALRPPITDAKRE